MKNLVKKLSLIIVACLCVVGFAYADGDKEEESGVTVCSLLPIFCGVTTNGDGGGLQPPPKE